MIAKLFQALHYWPVLIFMKICFRFEVRGHEHLRGLNGKAVIFAANHASYIDGPILAAAMPRNGTWYPRDFFPLVFPVTERFFQWRSWYILSAIFLRLAGCIKLTKNGHALKKLTGTRMVIFPEGGWDDNGQGKLGKAKRGIAFVQQQTGALVVPVGISGNFGITIGTLFKNKRLVVHFGRPIAGLSGTFEERAGKVMQKISRLIEEVGDDEGNKCQNLA